MAGSLSKWLMLTRVFQLLGALAAAGMNGYLTAIIYINHLGVAQSMVVLELLICITLLYTTLAMFIQHTGERTKKKGWLIAFVVLDIHFCAVDLTIITLLARAGLPDNCDSLAQFTTNDHTGWPFAVSGGGQPDKFCGYERSFFFIALALVFTYLAAVVLGSLGIYETNHTKDSKVREMLDSLERANNDVELKLIDSAAPSPLTTRAPQSIQLPPPAPQSEGYITRTASLRSTLTSLTTSTTAAAAAAYRSHTIPRRPLNQQPPPLPPRRPLVPKASPPPSGLGRGIGFVPIPLTDDDAAADALVADGMQHQHHHQHHHHQGHHCGNDGGGSSSSSSSSAQQGGMMPMLLEEEQTADSALVSDGMRPEPSLPPYEPRGGGGGMPGHGGEESNEMRLSDYVKGGTRAQDMKDSGRY